LETESDFGLKFTVGDQGPDFQKILGQTYKKLRIRSDLGKS